MPEGLDQARDRRGRPARRLLAVDGDLPRVRVQALRTLGAVGDTEHVDVVRELLDDEDQAVRRQAARSLTLLARRLDLDIDGF